jgi:hypothetical protein
MSIEAMKQWREALRKARRKILTTEECHAAITSIDQAIAEAEKARCDGGTCGLGGYCDDCPKQQPVRLKPCAYESNEKKMCRKCGQVHAEAIWDTHPQPLREPLTDEQRDAARYRWLFNDVDLAEIKDAFDNQKAPPAGLHSAVIEQIVGFYSDKASVDMMIDSAIKAAHGIKGEA